MLIVCVFKVLINGEVYSIEEAGGYQIRFVVNGIGCFSDVADTVPWLPLPSQPFMLSANL